MLRLINRYVASLAPRQELFDPVAEEFARHEAGRGGKNFVERTVNGDDFAFLQALVAVFGDFVGGGEFVASDVAHARDFVHACDLAEV